MIGKAGGFMRYRIWLGLLLLPGFLAQALVDTKNGNYTQTYVDFSVPGFTLKRTYNSRTLYRGLFGYGWSSNLETRVDVMPDHSLTITEGGGGVEISYTQKGKNGPDQKHIIQRIMAKMNQKGLSTKDKKRLEKELHERPVMRAEMMRALGLEQGAVKSGMYYAIGRPNETLHFTGRIFKRTLPSGTVQLFNKNGHLIKMIDRSGSWVNIVRRGQKITKILTNNGTNLQFQPIKTKKQKGFAIANSSTRMTYIISGDNLVRATNIQQKTYEHTYDRDHNMIKTRYPDGTYDTLTYNVRKDRVSHFKNRSACLESYRYAVTGKNRNHYWTDVRKTCNGRVTNISRYEFWNQQKKGGGKYLYRARRRINGRITADVIFDEKSGAPLSVTRNGVTVRYSYDPITGFLLSRTEPRRTILFSNYDKTCKKPTRVVVNYKNGKKVIQTVQTKIVYHPTRCFLDRAQQVETGRWVIVKRDNQLRIVEIQDQSNKRILVSYNNRSNKPSKITRPGVGAIVVSYDKKGRVKNKKENAPDPIIAAQVTSVFNEFLTIISPITANMSI